MSRYTTWTPISCSCSFPSGIKFSAPAPVFLVGARLAGDQIQTGIDLLSQDIHQSGYNVAGSSNDEILMGILTGIARREKKRAPMEAIESAEVSRETGVANDSRGKPGNRQVTLLFTRNWQATCEELGIDVAWTTRRANLLIEDMNTPGTPGSIIAIGDVRLRTTMEIDPCSRMDEQVPGLKRVLQSDWRGGVGCEVIHGGSITVGDEISLLNSGD
jgi:MOSC domain-containing protein YiiM